MFTILCICSDMFLDSGLKLLNYLCVILLKSSTRSNFKIFLATLRGTADNAVESTFVLYAVSLCAGR